MTQHHNVEIDRTSAVVVYDRVTGDVLHIHECISLRGGEHPTQAALEADALAQLSEDTARKPTALLHVDPQEIVPGADYRVDLKQRSLVVAKRQT